VSGKCFEVALPGGEGLRRARPRHLVLRADEWRESIDDPRTVGLVGDEVATWPSFAESLGGRVRLEHSGLGLHDLASAQNVMPSP
jgi:hypothetical protein